MTNIQMPTDKQKEFLYGDLSYKINGILFKVHNELGRFAREKQYANLVEKYFNESTIFYRRELTIGDSGNIVDFLIEDKIILELKAKPFLTSDEYGQVQRYLQACQLRLGILVNFREKFIKPRRILHPL